MGAPLSAPLECEEDPFSLLEQDRDMSSSVTTESSITLSEVADCASNAAECLDDESAAPASSGVELFQRQLSSPTTRSPNMGRRSPSSYLVISTARSPTGNLQQGQGC